MEIKEIFVARPTDNEQKEFIITVGKHLATKKKFKTKEEAENYIKYPKWDTTFALIAEMIESNDDAKYEQRTNQKNNPIKQQNNGNN